MFRFLRSPEPSGVHIQHEQTLDGVETPSVRRKLIRANRFRVLAIAAGAALRANIVHTQSTDSD